MTRVSPPELARELPGPQASSRVTRAPWRRKNSAVQPPKAPAPTTAMCGCLALDTTPPIETAAVVWRNERRVITRALRAQTGVPRPDPQRAAAVPTDHHTPHRGSRPRRRGPTTCGECSPPLDP